MTVSLKSLITVLICVDWLVVVVGIVGNMLVMISLLKYNSIKNAITRMLFTNLAITDMGVLIVRHTFYSVQLYFKGRWIFGEFACRVMPPVSKAFLTVSFLTLVAISYHRYKGIVHVLRPEQSVRKSAFVVVLMWLIILSLNVAVDVPFHRLNETTRRCEHTLSRSKYYVSVIVEKGFYVLCFVAIFFMFSRMKRALLGSLRVQQNSNIERRISHSVRTLRLLKPTVFVLFMTLCPAWVLHTIAVMKRDNFSIDEKYLLYHIVGILMVINSSANPFIYCMASRSIKDSFRLILFGVFEKCRKKNARKQSLCNQHPILKDENLNSQY